MHPYSLCSLPNPTRRQTLAESFDLSSLLGEYRDEAREQLDRLDAALLAIEESGSIAPDASTALLRALHTLKGNSGMLGLRPIVEAVHAIEEVFKEATPEFSGERLDRLFEAAAGVRKAVEQAGTDTQDEAFRRLSALDLARRLMPGADASTAPRRDDHPAPSPEEAQASSAAEEARLPLTESPQSEPTTATNARVDGPEAESGETAGEFLRVPFAKLDQLLDEVGELTSVVAAFHGLLEREEEALAAAGVERPLGELVELLDRTARSLRSSTMDIRLVPVQRVFSRFPSLARELAREQGKRVRVVLEGGEVELDRSMVEALGDPLLHLVRNAVDHGVRPPEERRAAGKPATGTIILRAERSGDRVRVEVIDDGPGIDLQAVRARARTLGLLGEQASLSDAEAAEMVFAAGFSTRASSDTVSGRGIGLDAVRQRVTALRGHLSVEMAPGGGTRIALDLPLTLAILPALLFEAEGGIFALPTVSVERTVRGAAPERAGGTEVLRLDDGLVPVARAGRIFGWHERSDSASGEGAPFAVVVRSGSRRGAVLANRLVEHRDLVVKALPSFLGRVAAVSGASVAPDGRVVLLLDPAGLLDLNLAAHQRENSAITPTQDPRRRG